MTRAKRFVTLSVVSGIGIVVISAFLLDRESSAILEGEILTSYARFSTTQARPLLGDIAVVSMIVNEVRLADPAARSSAAAHTWFDTTVEGGMSRVSQMQLAAEARVEIRSVPNTSILEVELHCPERCRGFRINNTGRHETSIPGSQPLRSNTSRSYLLEPAGDRVSMVLNPAPVRPLVLAKAVRIATLEFTDIENLDNSVESSSQSVSSILGGKYRLPAYDSEWEDLQTGIPLTFAIRDGTINRLEAHGDTLRITFVARISSGTHGSAPLARALIPLRIRLLAHQNPLVLLFTGFVTVGTVFGALLRILWKGLDRGPDTPEGLPDSERAP